MARPPPIDISSDEGLDQQAPPETASSDAAGEDDYEGEVDDDIVGAALRAALDVTAPPTPASPKAAVAAKQAPSSPGSPSLAERRLRRSVPRMRLASRMARGVDAELHDGSLSPKWPPAALLPQPAART